jgi:hypothetical protein
MTFGPEYPDLCLSRFSTPVSAYAAIITEPAFEGRISLRSGNIHLTTVLTGQL